jgi:hypothetical protein
MILIMILSCPVWESQTDLIRVLSGIKNYITGNKGNASEIAQESPVAEPLKSLEKADTTADDDVDAEFMSYITSDKKAVEPV